MRTLKSKFATAAAVIALNSAALPDVDQSAGGPVDLSAERGGARALLISTGDVYLLNRTRPDRLGSLSLPVLVDCWGLTSLPAARIQGKGDLAAGLEVIYSYQADQAEVDLSQIEYRAVIADRDRFAGEFRRPDVADSGRLATGDPRLMVTPETGNLLRIRVLFEQAAYLPPQQELTAAVLPYYSPGRSGITLFPCTYFHSSEPSSNNSDLLINNDAAPVEIKDLPQQSADQSARLIALSVIAVQPDAVSRKLTQPNP